MPQFDMLPNTLYRMTARYQYGVVPLQHLTCWYLTNPTLPAGPAPVAPVTGSWTNGLFIHVLPWVSSHLRIVEVVCDELAVAGGATGRSYSQPSDLPGRAEISAVAPQDVVTVRRLTGISGRRYHGRWHIAGFPSAWVVAGQVRPNLIGQLRASANVFTTLPLTYTNPGEVTVGRPVMPVPTLGEIDGAPYSPVRIVASSVDHILRTRRNWEIDRRQ